MYKLLWVINLSEVQNSSYALIKGKFEEQLGKNIKDLVTSYATRDNINDYIKNLEKYDCIIFGSNCFRDIVIWEAFDTDDVKIKMSTFIKEENKACIFMHQLLADGKICKLFHEIEELDFEVKRKSSAEKETGVMFTLESDNYKLYPNRLEEDQIFKYAKEDPFQAGVFWEIYSVDEGLWNSIIQTQEGRPLVRVSKLHKVILSNMLLDEQWHFEVLENLIVNLLSGGINIGIVSDGMKEDFSYKALIGELRRRQIHFARYDWNNPKDLESLEYRIENNIHTSIIIDGDDEKLDRIKKCCQDNQNVAKSIQYRIDNENENMIMVTEGISNEKLNFLLVELEIQKALGQGLIEKSFSTTMKILSIIQEASKAQWRNEYKNRKYPCYSERKYVRIIEGKIKANCQADGSYDDSFAATCQMIWYYNISGEERKKKKAQQWLIQNYKKYYKELSDIGENGYVKSLGIREVLDCFEACQGCNMCGIDIAVEESAHEEELIKKLEKEPGSFSTYDLIAIFRFAFRVNNFNLMCKALDLAIQKNNSFDEDLKLCLAITKFLKNITDFSVSAEFDQSKYGRYLSRHIGAIRDWKHDKNEEFLMKRLEIAYLLCEYDELQKIPQNVILRMLENDQVGFNYQQCKKAILEVQDFRVDNFEKGIRIGKLEKWNNWLKKYTVIYFTSSVLLVFVLYALICVLKWLFDQQLLETAFNEIVLKGWDFHSAVAVGVGFVGKFLFELWFKKRHERKEEGE